MGEKSMQKREHILAVAREVFAKKGYKGVTMKDIVEACNISRGGLYLYFESTKELFLEVLQKEAQETDDVFAREITKEAGAGDILALFLKEQKRELLRRKHHMTAAVYEYFFENRASEEENLIRTRFEEAVSVIEQLIQMGVENGEFYPVDPTVVARNIMYVIEGMKVAAETMGLTGEAVDQQFLHIMQGLVIEE